MFDLRAYSSLQRNRACAGSPTCARCRVTSEDREVVLQRAVLLKHMSEFAANVFPFSILKLLSVLFHRKVNTRGSVNVHGILKSVACALFVSFSSLCAS